MPRLLDVVTENDSLPGVPEPDTRPREESRPTGTAGL
jgi:hypothetical protein